ncbi:MAG: nuclear transport factor 2 family protein [Gemmatimonadota bacterium]
MTWMVKSLVVVCAVVAGTTLQPRNTVDELLAADRAFSAASARSTLVDGIAAMLADSVIMPSGPTLAEGKANVVETLRSNPDNLTSRFEWSPVRGGVSADGQHGFTFGYGTVTKADNSTVPVRYLAYWVKGPQGWRLAAYKRGRRPDAPAPTTLMPPSLPPRAVAPTADAKIISAHLMSLMQAEEAFSDEAGRIGLGPAFAKWGSDDAMNMGRPNDTTFVIGAERIGKAVGAGSEGPSPVVWKSDKALVASSGDLGVSFGRIRQKTDVSAPGQPFFTVWRRAGPNDPWRYIAE